MSPKPKRQISFKKSELPSGKENNVPTAQSIRTKKVELNSSFRDFRSTANRKFSTFVNVLDNLSERLRQSVRRRALTDTNYSALNEASSAQVTPVKLYSPFGIETPSPAVIDKKKQTTDKFLAPRRFEFSSPTGKLKKDVRSISEGLSELNNIVQNMEGKLDTRKVP